jgi:predicted nucleic acid-binding protein
MTIIVDTNFLFALKAKKDKNRDRAIEIFRDFNDNKQELITSYHIVSEVLTLAISRSFGDISFLEQIYNLVLGDEKIMILYQFTPSEYQKIFDILRKYCTPKRLLSFVDASLIYLYEKLNADYILSFDSHFDHIAKRLF